MRNRQKSDRARQLRRGMTQAERHLWSILRLRQLDGHRFRRQHPVGPYIADFACVQAGLVIEVDGGQHMDSASDGAREVAMLRAGFHVLRFWNHEVLENLEGVRMRLVEWLATACPHPSPPPQAEEGADPAQG